jgi:NAD-dependent dihydropyrimidine dehydrogenase PreA subunit
VTYVISEPRVGVKDASCTTVCPVDCIHPTPEEPNWEIHDQLYIDPADCVDCDARVVECRVETIAPADAVPPQWGDYIERNAAYFGSAER